MSTRQEKTKVYLISKPLRAPWNDSSKNLAKILVDHLSGSDCRFVQSGAPKSSFQPTLAHHVRLFAKLLAEPARPNEIYHFFFTPNPLSCFFLNVISRVKKIKTVHTICSRPDNLGELKKFLSADRYVALSDDTLSELRAHGIQNAVRIYPSYSRELLSATVSSPILRNENDQDKIFVLYAGDYEFTGGHEVLMKTMPGIVKKNPKIHFVFACRTKTPAASVIAGRIQDWAAREGLAENLRLLSEVSSMPALIKECDLLVFPASSLRKKMDLPMVLLEAMELQKPILASRLAPLCELLGNDRRFLVEDLKESDWRDKILDACQHRENLRTLGQGLYRSRAAEFIPDRMAAAYQELYKELAFGGDQDQKKKNYYDSFSQHYESRRHQGYHALLDDMEAQILRTHGKRGGSALEVGCGTGLLMQRLKHRFEPLIGIDPSPKMIEKAASKGLDVRLGEAEHLPFENNTFDTVYSCKVLAHVENIRKAMQEMSRVTKPGGTIVVEFYNRRSIRYWRWNLRRCLLSLGKNKGLSEKDIFTRYDYPGKIHEYFPSELSVIGRHGLMIWTPLALLHRVPGLCQILRVLEKKTNTWPGLSSCGGFLVFVLRKRS